MRVSPHTAVLVTQTDLRAHAARLALPDNRHFGLAARELPFSLVEHDIHFSHPAAPRVPESARAVVLVNPNFCALRKFGLALAGTSVGLRCFFASK
ncbi:Virion core protein [Saltwater crocodilepox virus]|nr:Virion core protein [Saltwater crocodilepox virus]AVD69512.1 Virion core protein [Saltwater crocodilepox virus]QGT46615.1 ORF178 [Saltwater crocodilepox virus]QGT46831.1 ORF178 [Saltwater crocodilepox virus]QGT47046.1 ORF178 [Saltwater crocodilepox virus]